MIPCLSEKTKVQIEGSFKITGDKALQKLALTEADDVERNTDDELLMSVIQGGDSVK